MKKYFNNFCLVGLGNHSINKLIPAMSLSNGNLVSIVTRKKTIYDNLTTYKNLETALKKLNKNTIIVLCTPPKIREKQIILCLKNSFSVISEKPMFVDMKSLEIAYAMIKENKLFLFENYMYLYSNTFTKFSSYFFKYKNKITKININFTIPNFPLNSFRSNQTLDENIIYDIACYPISLINFLKIKINNIDLMKVNKKKNNFLFLISTENFKLEINVGIGNRYQNLLCIYLNSNKYDLLKFNYFFYGIEKKKKIFIYKNKKKLKEENYLDFNAFTKIFNFSHNELSKLGNSYSISKKNTKLMNGLFKLVNSSY